MSFSHAQGLHVDTFNVGDTIDGKYELTEVLGKGGMGLVLAARRPGLSTLVALKVLRPELRDKPDLAGRFAREARAGDALRSEHVARVLDVGTTSGGTPFIVMEHLTGQDLAAVIKARGKLPVADAADLLLQACEAIAEAHTHGIIHRDLKPANLFVTTSVDGLPFVKVLDFGIAKASFPDDVVVTETASFFGSPLYMSPEQLGRQKDADPRSDVWALGIILYETLAGAPPFTGETFPLVCAAILAGNYAKLSALRTDLPAGIDTLITEALAPKPESRLASVEAFARKLARFGTGGARQSYERIERLAAGKVQPELARPQVALLADTAAGLEHSQASTDRPFSRTDVPAPAKRARSGMSPRVLGVVCLAGLAIVGGLFGFRQMRSASHTTASSSPPAPECAKGATPACEAACAAHAPGRCEALAKALVHGTGAAKDVARAEKLYQAECDGGAGSACSALGALYGSGTDVPEDNPKAVKLYKRGCELADRTACVNLGGMLFAGTGVGKNEALALNYFLKGCPASGPVEPLGCVGLSVAYSKGLGAPKDASQALSYAKQACDNGAPRGCTLVSMAKLTGGGVAKDVPGALTELDGMCARGEPSACAELIGLFSRGLGTDVPRDPAHARAVAEKGCKGGDAQSCRVQRLLEREDALETTVAQSTEQLETSCQAGVLANCGFLGERLLAGDGVTMDRARGLALLDRACKGGVARACEKLAEAGGR